MKLLLKKFPHVAGFNEVFETFCLEIQNTNVITEGFQPLKKYHSKAAGLQEFFYHSDILSCITFHIR